MPFNGSGSFGLVAGNPVVTGTSISSVTQNSTETDISNGLTNCITRDGQSPATGNLPMGGYKHTGVGAGSADTDGVNFFQLGVIGVEEKTASGSAFLEFLNLNNSYYELVFDALRLGTSGADLYVRFSITNGGAWIAGANYKYARSQVNDTGATGDSGSAGASAILVANAAGSGVADGFMGHAWALNFPAQGGACGWHLKYRASDSAIVNVQGSGSNTSTYNALQIIASSGVLTDGSVRLYRRKEF